MINSHDHVDFYGYDRDSGEMKKWATVSFIDGKLVFSGEFHKRVEESVNKHPDLKDYFDEGPYAVLARLEHTFHGQYFHATGIIPASAL